MLKLIDDKDTYEITHKLEDESEDKHPVFTMRKLTANQVNQIDDQLTKTGEGTTMHYLGGTSRRLKIESAVVDWRNVFDESGNPAPCNNANKGKLPASVQSWLEDDIDEVNKLRGTGREERKKS